MRCQPNDMQYAFRKTDFEVLRKQQNQLLLDLADANGKLENHIIQMELIAKQLHGHRIRSPHGEGNVENLNGKIITIKQNQCIQGGKQYQYNIEMVQAKSILSYKDTNDKATIEKYIVSLHEQMSLEGRIAELQRLLDAVENKLASMRLEKYLSIAMDSLNGWIEKEKHLCSLKTLNYRDAIGSMPVYTLPEVQYYYLLKYAYAYIYEYSIIYQDAFIKSALPNHSILSIGCGANLDYWGAIKALQNIGLPQTTISYIGIDLIDWAHKVKPRTRDSLKNICTDITTYLDSVEQLNCDIVIFPKSISDFTPDCYNILCDSLAQKLRQSKFQLLISHNYNRNDYRVEQLVESITKKGYVTSSKNTEQLSCPGGKIYEMDHAMQYPPIIKNKMHHLIESCTQYQMNGKGCKEDCSLLTYYPMTSTDYLAFRSIEFKR